MFVQTKLNYAIKSDLPPDSLQSLPPQEPPAVMGLKPALLKLALALVFSASPILHARCARKPSRRNRSPGSCWLRTRACRSPMRWSALPHPPLTSVPSAPNHMVCRKDAQMAKVGL